jgi:hypothetical protein
VIFDVLAMAPAERSPGRGSGERKPERSEAPSQCRPSCERERCLLASSPPSSSASAYRTMASLPSTRPVRTVMRHWPPSSWRGGLLLMLKTRSVCLSLPPFTVCSQRYGRTPLHLACREGHKVVVSLLLERGATVDALTTVCVSPSLPPFTIGSQSYRTPLHHACREGHKAVASLLLERAADREIRDKATILPLSLDSLSTEWQDSLGSGQREQERSLRGPPRETSPTTTAGWFPSSCS